MKNKDEISEEVFGLIDGYKIIIQRLEREKAELAEVIVDLVDGEQAHDLQEKTGLSIERCKEIRNIFDKLIKDTK